MKKLKRPTRKQIETIAKNRLNVENWLIERDTPDELWIVHKLSNEVKIIVKEGE